MQLGSRRHLWTWLLVLLPTAGMGSMAGDVELDMDPDDPDPDAGKEAGDKWNPTYVCESEEGDTMFDLLFCLVGGIAGSQGACIPGPAFGGGGTDFAASNGIGDCDAHPSAREDWELSFPFPYGFRIGPALGNPEPDVERLVLWENHDSILGVRLLVNRPCMVARIGSFVEKPAQQGSVVVTLDGRTVTVPTVGLKKALDLTYAVLEALETLDVDQDQVPDLDVRLSGGFIYVMENLESCLGINEVRVYSDDPNIASTDLALLPIEETGLAPEQEP